MTEKWERMLFAHQALAAAFECARVPDYLLQRAYEAMRKAGL